VAYTERLCYDELYWHLGIVSTIAHVSSMITLLTTYESESVKDWKQNPHIDLSLIGKQPQMNVCGWAKSHVSQRILGLGAPELPTNS